MLAIASVISAQTNVSFELKRSVFPVRSGSLLALDLNNDGVLDLVASFSNRREIDVLFGKVGCAFSPALVLPTSTFIYTSAVAGDFNGDGRAYQLFPVDVNGDGIADLVAGGLIENNSRNGLVAWLGRPDGSFNQTAQKVLAGSGDTGATLAGDFNRDGRMNFLIAAGDKPEPCGA